MWYNVVLIQRYIMAIQEELYLQINYLRQMSSSLSMFKEKGNNIFNCRCPLCGDSTKSRTKARGYFTKSTTDGLLMYKCHNCGKALPFMAMLKIVDKTLHSKYLFTLLKDSKAKPAESNPMEINTDKSLAVKLSGSPCVCVDNLSRLHPVRVYLKERMIPSDKLSELYYTEDFDKFCSSIKVYSDVPNDPRIMMFETDIFGNIKLIIARSIGKTKNLRYIILKVDDNAKKIYGLRKAKKDQPCFVVEGAIDSLFLDNAVASLDANLSTKDIGLDKPIYVLDNEPRSRIIVNKLKKIIDNGDSVVIFDEGNTYKDINKMVENGIDIKEYIKTRIFKGIKARMEFNKWKKI